MKTLDGVVNGNASRSRKSRVEQTIRDLEWGGKLQMKSRRNQNKETKTTLGVGNEIINTTGTKATSWMPSGPSSPRDSSDGVSSWFDLGASDEARRQSAALS